MYFVSCIIMALIPLLGIIQEGKIQRRNIKIFPFDSTAHESNYAYTKSNPNYEEG